MNQPRHTFRKDVFDLAPGPGTPIENPHFQEAALMQSQARQDRALSNQIRSSLASEFMDRLRFDQAARQAADSQGLEMARLQESRRQFDARLGHDSKQSALMRAFQERLTGQQQSFEGSHRNMDRAQRSAQHRDLTRLKEDELVQSAWDSKSTRDLQRFLADRQLDFSKDRAAKEDSRWGRLFERDQAWRDENFSREDARNKVLDDRYESEVDRREGWRDEDQEREDKQLAEEKRRFELAWDRAQQWRNVDHTREDTRLAEDKRRWEKTSEADFLRDLATADYRKALLDHQADMLGYSIVEGDRRHQLDLRGLRLRENEFAEGRRRYDLGWNRAKEWRAEDHTREDKNLAEEKRRYEQGWNRAKEWRAEDHTREDTRLSEDKRRWDLGWDRAEQWRNQERTREGEWREQDQEIEKTRREQDREDLKKQLDAAAERIKQEDARRAAAEKLAQEQQARQVARDVLDPVMQKLIDYEALTPADRAQLSYNRNMFPEAAPYVDKILKQAIAKRNPDPSTFRSWFGWVPGISSNFQIEQEFRKSLKAALSDPDYTPK